MSLTYLNRPRYYYSKVPATAGSWSLTTYSANGVAVEDIKSPLVKGVTDGKWRKPTFYERTVRRFSGCEAIMEGTVVRFSAPNRYRQTGGIVHNSGYDYPSLPAFPTNLSGRAVNEALNSLKEQRINLAVAFGERKETARFVGDTLQDMAGIIKALRKKDLKQLYKRLKNRRKRQRHAKRALEKAINAPSKLVLTNAYALGPLLGDIYGAMDALNEADLADPKRYGVSAKKFVREKIESEFKFTHGFANGLVDAYRADSGMHGCMVRLDYYLENPLLRTLTQLGLTNPAELAWELIPFSFVADWLLPVGSYLGALDATVGLSFKSGSRSELTKVQYKYFPGPKSSYQDASWRMLDFTEYSFNGSGKATWLKRVPYTASPSAVFPSFKNPVSLTHALNALSLVQQLLKSK